MTRSPERSHTIPARPRPIVRATDLGAVRALKHGSLFLLADAFGDVRPDSRGLGLYDGDTRVLSCAVLRIDGNRPVVLRSDDGGGWRGVVELTNGDLRDRPGEDAATLPARESIGITRERWLAGPTLHERISVANFTLHDYEVLVELELDADFADIFEVRGYERPERGELLPVEVEGRELTFGYRGTAGLATRTRVEFGTLPTSIEPAPVDGDGVAVVRWRLPLPGGERHDLVWSASIRYAGGLRDGAGRAVSRVERIVASALREQDAHRATDPAEEHARWWSDGALIASDNELVELTLRRGIDDLRVLVNDGPGEDQWYIAAGVPWFATLFGRDALITAFQTLPFHPAIAVATLEVLASVQATEHDDWRDAEPGKMPHELRTGELSRAGVLPFSPYYGTADATPLWLVLLGATWDWTADRALVDRLWPHALRALEWIDRWGDADGDGFVEYARRSSAGLRNQGWKDSGDSIRDRRGRLAEGPIALAEVQGYVYDAKRRMARLARVRGDEELAVRLDREADELARRFEERFWLPELGWYAMALDGEKRPADALGSVGGHLLWSGIAGPARGEAIEAGLLGPSLFSGWGIRTLAADQAGYNPLGYHIGTVWPHDTAIAAAGLKRAGRDEAASRIAQSLLESAQHFPAYRLPELFCGFDRAATTVPVAYPTACSPQAWAAGAPFLLLQTLLGLEAHAAESELRIVHPTLPPWISRLTVRNLRVGSGHVDLLFHRWRGMTAAELLGREGGVSVSVRL